MPTLYLVATPIGNIEDITLRALRVLKEVSVIAAEDTRTTRKLLSHYDIHTRLTSYNEHNADARTPALLQALESGDVALVSDAGMPAISDPGRRLVEAAAGAGFAVSPVPGPSALPAALAVSGLPNDHALFLGFLPNRGAERKRLLATVAPLPFTLVFYEAPHRLQDRLGELLEALGNRRIAVCREMTKVYEEIFRGTIRDAIDHFDEPRGEFVLVVEGSRQAPTPPPDDSSPLEALRALRTSGASAKEAVAEVSRRFHLPRRAVYAMWLEEDAANG